MITPSPHSPTPIISHQGGPGNWPVISTNSSRSWHQVPIKLPSGIQYLSVFTVIYREAIQRKSLKVSILPLPNIKIVHSFKTRRGRPLLITDPPPTSSNNL